VPGLALLFAIPLIVATLALFFLLRRERMLGSASTTHPLLVGFYRGCAIVLIAFVGYLLLAPIVLRLVGRWPD
jgi:hypothetical protein